APAPIAATLPVRNMRRCRSPLPATNSVSLRDVSFMLNSSLRIIALGAIVVRSARQGTGGCHFSEHRATHLVPAVLISPHDKLGLRYDGGELAVASGDPGLPDHGGAAAMERRAFRPQGIAKRDRSKEIGLALDCGRAGALRQIEEGRGAAEIV